MVQNLIKRVATYSDPQDKSLGDLVCAAVLSLVGIGIAVRGASYGIIRSDGIIGPGFLPLLCGIVLAAFGAGLTAKATLRMRAKRRMPAEAGSDAAPVTSGEDASPATVAVLESDFAPEVLDAPSGAMPEEEGKAGSGRALAIVFAAILVGLIVSRWLGLIISLTLAVFSILWLAERKNVIRSAIIALVIGVVIYLIFIKLLQIPLPWGVLESRLPANFVS